MSMIRFIIVTAIATTTVTASTTGYWLVGGGREAGDVVSSGPPLQKGPARDPSLLRLACSSRPRVHLSDK